MFGRDKSLFCIAYFWIRTIRVGFLFPRQVIFYLQVKTPQRAIESNVLFIPGTPTHVYNGDDEVIK